MNDNQKYLLDKTLNRIDICVNTVNTKSSFLTTINIFLLGSIILKYEDIMIKITNKYLNIIMNIDIVILFIGIIFSLLFCFLSIKPFLKSGNINGEYTSLLFFGSINSLKYETYKDKIIKLKDTALIEDLIRQNYLLSEALNKKFINISRSFFFLFYFELSSILTLVLIIFLNSIIK